MSASRKEINESDSHVSRGERVVQTDTSRARKTIHSAFIIVQPLCAIDCSARSAEEQEILLQANVLLAEICSLVCNNSKKTDNRDLWTRRVIKTEKCIHAVDAAIARGIFCSVSSKYC